MEVLFVAAASTLLAACHSLLEIDEIEFGSGAGGAGSGDLWTSTCTCD